jgi:hypothetical protein
MGRVKVFSQSFSLIGLILLVAALYSKTNKEELLYSGLAIGVFPLLPLGLWGCLHTSDRYTNKINNLLGNASYSSLSESEKNKIKKEAKHFNIEIDEKKDSLVTLEKKFLNSREAFSHARAITQHGLLNAPVAEAKSTALDENKSMDSLPTMSLSMQK